MQRGILSFRPCSVAIFLSAILSVAALDAHYLYASTHDTTTAVTQQPTTHLHLFWRAPTTNRDGSALQDLAGYRLHYGESSRNYTTSHDVGNQTSYTLQGLQSGRTYYVAVTAYDASGNESAFSAEIIITMTPTGPRQHVSTSPVPRGSAAAASQPHREQPSQKPTHPREQKETVKAPRQMHSSVPSPAGQSPSLMPTVIRRGHQARFQVRGTQPGDVVFFLFSTTGTGAGPCSPQLGDICVDLLAPQVFGQATADESGTASLLLPIPEAARVGQQVSIQAVVRRSAGSESHVKTAAQTIRVQ